MALAEPLLAAEFGDEIVHHRTYVIASDGDLMEDIRHETSSLAGHLGLNKLIVLYDDNSVSIDGRPSSRFPTIRCGGSEAMAGPPNGSTATITGRSPQPSGGPSKGIGQA
jgi:hypothetical protein